MGVGAYTTFTKEWSGIFLLTNGNDTFLVPEDEARMFGKITYASANQHDNVQLGWTLGRGRFNAGAPFAPATLGLAQEPAGHNNFNAIDIIYTRFFNPTFTYVNESMYAWQTAVPANPNGGIIRAGVDTPGTAHWASSCHYFRFTLSSRGGDAPRGDVRRFRRPAYRLHGVVYGRDRGHAVSTSEGDHYPPGAALRLQRPIAAL